MYICKRPEGAPVGVPGHRQSDTRHSTGVQDAEARTQGYGTGGWVTQTSLEMLFDPRAMTDGRVTRADGQISQILTQEIRSSHCVS